MTADVRSSEASRPHEREDAGRGPVDQVQSFMRLVARPSRWREVRLFSSPAEDALARRPTDIVLLVGAVLTLVVLSTIINATPTGFEAAVADVVANFPHFLDPLWEVVYDAVAVWAIALVAAAIVRRRWLLLLNMVLAGVVTAAVAIVLGRLTGTTWSGFGQASNDTYPAIRLATAVALVSTASPHLSRPLRYLGRWLVGLAALAALFLAAARPWGILAGYALGMGMAAAVHLLFGSPGGRPSLHQIRLALADLGIDAEPTRSARLRSAGVAVVDASGADGSRLLVKVYGRDAWDGQLIASLWRVLWYRGRLASVSLSRRQQVEHEAYLTLLAERRGAPVTPVLAAGPSASGDALLVVAVPGIALDDLPPGGVDDALLRRLWVALRHLHGAGVAHGRISADRILVGDGGCCFADFGEARVVSDVEPILADRAQLLVASALLVGPERAIEAAVAEIEPAGVAEVTPYLQPAALSSGLREEVEEHHLDLAALRNAAAAATQSDIPELRRLRRITWGTVLLGALMFVAGYFLISSLADIGWDNIVDSVKQASLPLVITALFIAQTPRFTQSFSVMAVSPVPLPLGRVTALEFATTFVNLAMPSTAGRVAVNIRFFQRAGASPGTAVAVGALDGLAGFVVQIGLMGSILLFGLGSVQLDLSGGSGVSNLGAILAIAAAVLVVAALVVLLVRRLRDWVFQMLSDIWHTAATLRSPRAVLQLLLANLVTEVLFGVAMWTVLRAFGQSVSLPDVILINEGVSLFAGMMPIPGGIGVAEAGLTAGFVAVGVPNATAFAAALTYRLISYYLPPIWGFFAFRWLQRRRYL